MFYCSFLVCFSSKSGSFGLAVSILAQLCVAKVQNKIHVTLTLDILLKCIKKVIVSSFQECSILFVCEYFYLSYVSPKSKLTSISLRLVFTSDAVVVGVVIRSVERYDLVKTKPTESEAEHWFCLWLRRLRSSENCIVGVATRSGRINQSQCSIPGLAIDWFFRFCFWLRQPSFHWIISDGVVNGIGRNGNVLILPTPIPLSLWLRLWLRFSIFTRS